MRDALSAFAFDVERNVDVERDRFIDRERHRQHERRIAGDRRRRERNRMQGKQAHAGLPGGSDHAR